MKDIKPGVLSKIFALSDQALSDVQDENLKRLIMLCKGLEQSLLNYANYKPSKKTGGPVNDKKLVKDAEMAKDLHEKNFKLLIEKIMEFK